MWWMWGAQGWASQVVDLEAGDPRRNTCDLAVCRSQAVFVGTELSRTCLPDGVGQAVQLRVDRVFKGQLPAVVTAHQDGGCPQPSGEGRVRWKEPRRPIVRAEQA